MLRTCSQSLTRTPWLNLTASEFFRGGPSRIVTDLFPVANENLTGCEFFRAPPGFLGTCYQSLTRTPRFDLTVSEFFCGDPPLQHVADLFPVANENPVV